MGLILISIISVLYQKKKKIKLTVVFWIYLFIYFLRISQCKSSAKGRSSGLRKHVRSAELDTHKAAAECSQGDLITIEDIKRN